MEKFMANLFFTFGSIYLSNGLLQNNEPKILHISDTPTVFYPALAKLINKLNPQYIIHTGDLVDNIKLCIYPNKLDQYQNGVASLINIMEKSYAEKIYITLGNHDHFPSIENCARKSIVIPDKCTLKIEDTTIKISHYHQDLINSTAKYNLFGHDVTLRNKLVEGRFFLNGIESINIITLYSGQVFTLPYPFGTNDARLCKFKIGI